MSDRAGSFEAGGEYAELHYPDLELSGPDDFAIFLIDREVHKAFTSSSSATSIPPWLLTLHRQRQEDQRLTPDENKCSILARESQAHRCAHSQDTLKVYCSPNKRCKEPSIAT